MAKQKNNLKITKDTKIEKEYGYLKIGNKYFELVYDEKNDNGTQKFIEVKDFKEKIKISKDLTKKLKKYLDKEKILIEILMTIPKKNLKMIKQELTKKDVKPKTRRHHCVDLKIGKHIIPIVNG